MPPLRVAVVGLGWIARDHLAALGRLDGAEVVAVCDVDPERAEAAAAGSGATTYGDWQELLERERIDALWVCTPPLAHRDPAVAALDRGIHVFLEKPIARTLDDGEAIVAAAARSDAVCAIGYQWRGTEVLDDLREAIAGQETGLLVSRSIGPTQGRPWFLDRAQGGGNVLERGSHQIDLQMAVEGAVVQVQAAASGVALAQSEGERGDIEDAATLVLHFASGALGTVALAWTRSGLPGLYTLDVVASETTLNLTLDPEFTLRGAGRGRAIEATTGRHPFERTIARFLEAAEAGDPSRVFCTPADAASTLAVAVACEQALAKGEAVPVPGA